MYTWQIDALAHPWQVRCPHCREFFPKNDFAAYHRSGLDEQGVFDPGRADGALLFNEEHPEESDPLRGFGVDDGEGYVEGGKRWRFIGAYLVYGQWKQLVLGGINKLSAAYVLTGDGTYAHKAGVLLDRVADLYGSFDFEKEGLAYERSHSTGYVSTWHDACEETRELAEAYDRVFEGLREDGELVTFLGKKAVEHGLENRKGSFAEVQRNIEGGILREALENADKIHSNYPRQENALLVMETVLGWPGNRERVHALLDDIIGAATAVDGVTGEKGLAGYGTIGPQSVAQILGLFGRLEEGFLGEVYGRHPKLRDLFRFHVDTRCLGRYYPNVGDSGGFTRPHDRYAGVPFAAKGGFAAGAGLAASMFSFMWRMYELTGEVPFVQVLYEGNGGSTEGLPHDLFCGNPEEFQARVAEVIEKEGENPRIGSVNKEEWHIGILRSGAGEQERALWLHYDAGGRHCHRDGMNLGLFARGMELLPEFGYPPVQFGGWNSERANWYKMTAGHNTVVVDGEDQRDGAGRTTLWGDGELFRVIRVAAEELYGIERYERTAMLVDVAEEEAYVVDLFRVVGGKDHARFLHSGFGEIVVEGVELEPAEEYGYGTQMRNFRGEERVAPGWSADWRVEDRYGVRSGGEVHLRYTDLTEGAGAFAAAAWVSLGYDEENAEAWVPRLIVRRRGEEPLASTFVGVLEPYEGKSSINSISRLSLETESGVVLGDEHVAVEVVLGDGRRDLIVALDVEHAPEVAICPEWDLLLEGELCWVRVDVRGVVERVVLSGRNVCVGGVDVDLEGEAFGEFRVVRGKAEKAGVRKP